MSITPTAGLSAGLAGALEELFKNPQRLCLPKIHYGDVFAEPRVLFRWLGLTRVYGELIVKPLWEADRALDSETANGRYSVVCSMSCSGRAPCYGWPGIERLEPGHDCKRLLSGLRLDAVQEEWAVGSKNWITPKWLPTTHRVSRLFAHE